MWKEIESRDDAAKSFSFSFSQKIERDEEKNYGERNKLEREGEKLLTKKRRRVVK